MMEDSVWKFACLHDLQVPDPEMSQSNGSNFMLQLLMEVTRTCSVGDAMNRGISGGQKKRLTLGEMLVGPTKLLFMDEISNGLDSYVSVGMFSSLYKESRYGYKLTEELSAPIDKSKIRKSSFDLSGYSLKKWDLFRTCMSTELLLMKRNSFIYAFKSVQLMIMASMTMTIFLRTR